MGQIASRLQKNRRVPTDTIASESAIPQEILLRVFKYLDVRSKGRAAQVCRTWRDIAYVRSVWEDVEVSRLWPKSLFDVYLSRGIHRIQVSTAPVPGRKLLRNMKDFISHRFRAQLTSADDLEISLTLEGAYNTAKIDRSLDQLLHMTSQSLRSLTLVSCRLTIINMIISECQNLVELSMRSVTDCPDLMESGRDAFWIALRDLRQLRSLQMLGIGSHSEIPGFDFFKCASDDRSPGNSAGDGVQRGSNVLLPSLTGLHLIWIAELTDSSLKFICRSMPNLIELDLTVMGHCEEFTLETMKRIAAMKQLRQLTLPNYHRSAYLQLGDSLKSFAPGPSDHAVNLLAPFGLLGQLHQLSVAVISDKSLDLISQCAYNRYVYY